MAQQDKPYIPPATLYRNRRLLELYRVYIPNVGFRYHDLHGKQISRYQAIQQLKQRLTKIKTKEAV